MTLFFGKELTHSDGQGFGKPLGYKGKGKEGKGQGTDYMTLDKPLTLQKGQGFSEGSEIFRNLYSSDFRVL